MAALCRTALMVAIIGVVRTSTDDIKHTTVSGQSLALNDTRVTARDAGVGQNETSAIGQRDATSNEPIDFDHRHTVPCRSIDTQINTVGKNIFSLFKAALSKSVAHRKSMRKDARTLIRTNQRKRFAGWLYRSRSDMFRSDLG